MAIKFSGWISDVLERFDSKPEPDRRLKRVEPPSPYRAVSVRAGLVSCEAAKQLGSRRFLTNSAPRFPLPECTCETCNCSYVHHADRRNGIDRRKALGKAPVAGFSERRITRGRRATDAAGFNDPLASY